MILELKKIAERDKVKFRDGKLYELISKDELAPTNVLFFLSTAEEIKDECDPTLKLQGITKMLAILLPGAPVETLSIGDAEQILNFFTERLQKALR